MATPVPKRRSVGAYLELGLGRDLFADPAARVERPRAVDRVPHEAAGRETGGLEIEREAAGQLTGRDGRVQKVEDGAFAANDDQGEGRRAHASRSDPGVVGKGLELVG